MNQKKNKSFAFKNNLTGLVAAALCTSLCGCGTAKVASRHQVSVAPTAKPSIIYVADFDLEAANIQSEPGFLPHLPKPPGLPVNILPPLPGTAKDPAVLARELVDAMSAAVVKDLNKAGWDARRVTARDKTPASGWLVRGVFTEVNQGNQLSRAIIGFGAGKTDLQVVVEVNDLSEGTPRPFYELKTTANSGKAPGAGPLIALNPAGAAARFVIAGGDLKRSVQQTAGKIATEVVQRTRQTPSGPGTGTMASATPAVGS